MKLNKVKLLLIAICLPVVTAGCGTIKKDVLQTEIQQTVEKPEKVTLKLWGALNDKDLLATMVESFQKHYASEADFDITIEYVDEGECKATALKDVNNAADVFAFAGDQLSSLAASGLIEKISNEEQIKSQNSENSVAESSINQSLYAYPMTADNGYFMYYNKKYFKQKDLETLDQMMAVASANKKKVTMNMEDAWYLYSFFGGTGLDLGVNDDYVTNYCDWNSKTKEIKGKDVGNALLSILKNPGFSSVGEKDFLEGVRKGSVIAGVSGIWNADELQKIWGADYAAVKLPTYTVAGRQVQMSSFSGYKMLGVNSNSKQKAWAEKLAEWITSQENQEYRFEVRGQGPSNKAAASSDLVKNSPAIKALLEQSEYAKLQYIGNNYWQAAEKFAIDIVNGKISKSTMQEELDKMVKGITLPVTG